MDEEKFTRNKSRPRSKEETEEVTAEKHFGKKLRNEDTRSAAMRGKLRFEKANTAESVDSLKKKEEMIKQGRQKSYAVATVSSGVHHQADEANEDDNAGVDAINEGSRLAERGIYRSKISEGRESGKAGYSEKLHNKPHVNEVKENSAERPYGVSREAPREVTKETSKELQKSRMKKEIQRNAIKEKAGESAGATGKFAKGFADKTGDAAAKIAEAVTKFLEEHPMTALLSLAILLVVLVITGLLGSCSMMAGGGNNMVISTSYTAQDSTLEAVESDYDAIEAELQRKVNNIRSDHPGYDEYNFSLSEIEHDPYELAALLTVLYEDYSEDEVQDTLQRIKSNQYDLKITAISETRTRKERRRRTVITRDSQGHTYRSYVYYYVDVEYEYRILNTSLTNKGIEAAVNASGLTDDQMERYRTLLELKGNKPDIFGE